METASWIAFFSQTGAEIADISEDLGIWPDRIITNERPENLRTIDPRIEKQGYFIFNNKPLQGSCGGVVENCVCLDGGNCDDPSQKPKSI